MIKKVFLLLSVLSLVLAACSSAMSLEQEIAPAYVEEPLFDMASKEGERAFDMDNTGFDIGSSPNTERMVIKDVQISLAVDDPEASAWRIQAMAEAMGGYVVALKMYQTTLDSGVKVPQGTITVRIPAERLTEALDKIKEETSQPVLNENIDSTDVTEDYIDLSSRLRNLEAAEAQLQEIMDEATKTEDVLAVYSQLVSTREQIELIKGKMQYYEQAAELSSVQVSLVANEAVQPLSIGSWQPVGVAKDAIQTLINTVKWLANVAIWIVLYLLPTAILILGPIALIVWGVIRISKRRKKAKATQQTKEE